MKTWIAKWMIARAEITGQPVPERVRRWMPVKKRLELENSEKQLTRLLREDSHPDEAMTEKLRGEIDRRLALEARISPDEPRFLFRPAAGYTLAALAAVAAVVFVFELKTTRPAQVPAATVAQTADVTAQQSAPRDSEAAGLNPEQIEDDVLLRPLAAEKERLASDMSGALRFMANSFLPPYMAERVDKNLNNLERDYVRGM